MIIRLTYNWSYHVQLGALPLQRIISSNLETQNNILSYYYYFCNPSKMIDHVCKTLWKNNKEQISEDFFFFFCFHSHSRKFKCITSISRYQGLSIRFSFFLAMVFCSIRVPCTSRCHVFSYQQDPAPSGRVNWELFYFKNLFKFL